MTRGVRDRAAERTGAVYRVWAVELDDRVWERRCDDQPNLHVDVTVVTDLEEHLSRIQSSGAKRGNARLREHGVRVRADLTGNLGWMTKSEADRQKRQLVGQLREEGYTVNGVTKVWRVYVIELTDAVGPRDPGFEWLYVGETSKDPQVRFAQHRAGPVNGQRRLHSTVVFKHWVRLRPDLYEQEPPLYSAAAAKRAEKALANRLHREGYSIKGGH